MAFVHVSTSATLQGKFRKEKAWEIISDYSRYPVIMENVEEVKIHERDEKEGISEWFVKIDEAPLNWIEEDHFDKENFELRFESLEGDFDDINGQWKIENNNHDGIKILFSIDYNLGIPVIEEVLGRILKGKMKSNIDSMIAAIKKSLEEQLEERYYERVALDTHHNITVNGNSIRATIVDVSQGGMMINYDGKLDLLNATVKINGEIIDCEIILNDLKRKNYRIVFKNILNEQQTEKIIKILSSETSQVQEAVVIEKESKSTVKPDRKDKDLVTK